jgi:predicted small secreted protein
VRTLTPLALLALAAVLTGCSNETDPDVGTDTESAEGTDADTNPNSDSDPDIDSHPDIDSDSTIVSGDLTGSHTYRLNTASFTVPTSLSEDCTAQFAVTGSEFVGDCNGCDWAFTLTASETSNACTTALNQDLALQPAMGSAPVTLAFWSTYNEFEDKLQGWTSTLMSNPTLWHAQFRRQLPSSNKLQRRQLATPLNAS